MRHASLVLIALASLFAPALFAQGAFGDDSLKVDVEPAAEGKAQPGGEYTFKLNFTVPDGYHAYHKDNPGFNVPVDVTFDETSGLTLKEEIWPEPVKKVDEFGEEWELNGNFDIAYIFEVPSDATGRLTVSGRHDTQFCDATGCFQSSGEFSAEIAVAAGEPGAEPETEPGADLPEVSATLSSDGPASAGGEAVLKLHFTFTPGYHTYHKDTPGYGLPPTVEFTELSGMEVKGTEWPEPTKHEYDVDWVEWEHKDELVLTYTLSVPEDAAVDLPVNLDWRMQVCNDDGCWNREGNVTATVSVASSPTTQPEAADETDEHGFYKDFDYALEKAKQEEKQLLVDFNGRY